MLSHISIVSDIFQFSDMLQVSCRTAQENTFAENPGKYIYGMNAYIYVGMLQLRYLYKYGQNEKVNKIGK